MKFKKMKSVLSDFTQTLQSCLDYFRSARVEKYTAFLIFIFVLSTVDALFTVTWLQSGLATEANPLLANLLNSGSFSFIATKTLMTFIGCFILYKVKNESLYAKSVILALLGMYILLTVYHVFGALVSIDESYLPLWVVDLLTWAS